MIILIFSLNSVVCLETAPLECGWLAGSDDFSFLFVSSI